MRPGRRSLAASTVTLRTPDLSEASHHVSLTPLGLSSCEVAQLEEQRWNNDWPAQAQVALVIPAQVPDRHERDEAISDISSPADVTWRKTEKLSDS